MKKRELWGLCGLLWLAVTARVESASLTGLRFGQHPERTRIVLDFLGTPSEYSVQEGQDGVEVLVKNSITTKPGPWPITDVRVKEIFLSSEDGMTRVRITLKKPVKVEAYALHQPYRIILDLTDKPVEEKSTPAHLRKVERAPQENGERLVLTFDRIPPYTYSEDKDTGSLRLHFQNVEMPAEDLQKEWKGVIQFFKEADEVRMEIPLKGMRLEKILPLPQEEKIILNFQNIPGTITGETSEKLKEEPSPSPSPEPQRATLFQSQEEILRSVTVEVKGEETFLILEFSQPVNFIARSQPPIYRLIFLDLYLPDISEPPFKLPGVESMRISSVPSGSQILLSLAESYRVNLQAETMKITLRIKQEKFH